ncbi:MAG TPA: DUF308 domain-containing protein [Terriglobia bacterium]|nr:DUF308 domain-containing protein [Terriglobia bacterium]
MSEATEAVSKRAFGWGIAWAILSIVAGMFALALPWEVSFGAVLVIGWVLIFSSVFQFLHAFQAKGAGSIAWKLLVAVLYLGVGIYFLIHPLLGMATLTLAISIFLFVEGIADLAAYFKVRGSPGAGWMLFNGIITVILALIIWRHLVSSAWYVIGILLGISMILTGMTRLMLTLAARRLRAVSSA